MHSYSAIETFHSNLSQKFPEVSSVQKAPPKLAYKAKLFSGLWEIHVNLVSKQSNL